MSDEDSIDRREWLPPKTPIINEFRLAKPDMAIDRKCDSCSGIGAIEGNRCKLCRGTGRLTSAWRGHDIDPLTDIRVAQAKIRNILSYLHSTRILDDQEAHDGRTYEIWYEIFKASANMTKKPLYGALRGELAREGLSEYGFVLLIQKMEPEYHQRIKQAIYTEQSESSRLIARREAPHHKRAFTRLTELIPQIRDTIKAKQEQSK